MKQLRHFGIISTDKWGKNGEFSHKHRWAQTPGQEVDKRYKIVQLQNKYTNVYCIDCGKKKITNWDRDEHFPYPENNWRR